jgi:hypothetical protein
MTYDAVMRMRLLALGALLLLACSGDDEAPSLTATPAAVETGSAEFPTPVRASTGVAGTPPPPEKPAPPPQPSERKDFLIDVEAATVREVSNVRLYSPEFARGGAALWTHTDDGLALIDLEGDVIEEIPGAVRIEEDAGGSARAYLEDFRMWHLEWSGTRIAEVEGYPKIAPDGKWIAIMRTSATNPNKQDVIIRDPITGREETIFSGRGQCHCDAPAGSTFHWSSVGRYLAFVDHNIVDPDPAKGYEIAMIVYDHSTGTTQRIDGFLSASGDSGSPWSPFAAELLVRPDLKEVQIFDAATGVLTPLLPGASSAMFLTPDRVGVNLGAAQTAVINVDDGSEVARWPGSERPEFGVFEGAPVIAALRAPDPACNGVLVVHPTQPAEGHCIEGASAPSWSPDGVQLAYLRGVVVAVLDLTTGVEREVFQYPQVPQFPVELVWNEAGTHLLATGYPYGL